MKRVAASAVFALMVCLVGLPLLAEEAASSKSHDMTVVFVSFDARAKMLHFKDDKGAEKSAPVMESAMSAFEGMKAGDRIMITCADNDKGEHQGVSVARLAGAAPKQS